MRHTLFLLATSVLTCACGSLGEQLKTAQAEHVADGITYTQDPRTGLCFAVFSTVESTAFAHVPCDPVAHLIKR